MKRNRTTLLEYFLPVSNSTSTPKRVQTSRVDVDASKCNKTKLDASAQETIDFPKKLFAIVYVYSNHDGTPVYVGQTVQELIERDRQHLAGNKTKFDKQYISRGQHSLCVLEQRVFCASDYDNDREKLMDECQKWLDNEETKYIKELNTYKKDDGYNQDSGGQGKHWLRKFLEANKKKSLKRFKEDYMPRIKYMVC